MVAWKKLHKSEDLEEVAGDMTEAQLMAFSISEAINYETLIILQARFDVSKLPDLREKFNKPSKLAEFVYKKFKGDAEAMQAFIEGFNAGATDGE